MHWFFPKNDGGRESGLHDAGVETFKGNLDRYLARELIQNSLDARHDLNLPAHVVFEALALPRSGVPGSDEVRDALTRCGEYWSDTPKVRDYFEEAAQYASGAVIGALRVRDFNTTGVPGADNDRQSN